MATTLRQALYNFQTQFRNARASESKRQIKELEQDWQEINNWWDIYFQAQAEGDVAMQSEAITGITDVLGGVIDASVLPVVSAGANQRFGIASVSPGLQKIAFTSDIGTTNYRLSISLYDSNGYTALYTRGAKSTDGFFINPAVGGTLEYTATAL